MQTGMNRRHFLQHVAAGAAVTLPSIQFIQSLRAAAPEMKKKNKSLIIFWMGGGPSHMDLWDLKPGNQNGGEFKEIQTKANGVKISEVLPTVVAQKDRWSKGRRYPVNPMIIVRISRVTPITQLSSRGYL